MKRPKESIEQKAERLAEGPLTPRGGAAWRHAKAGWLQILRKQGRRSK